FGSFTGKDVRTKKAVVSITGAGGAKITSGTADEIVVRVPGAGSFDGRELKGKTATVDITGLGSVVVNASESLTAKIAGLGSVRYIGTPKVDKSGSGMGSVSALKVAADAPKTPAAPTPPAKVDQREERIRQLEADLKRLQDELSNLKKR